MGHWEKKDGADKGSLPTEVKNAFDGFKQLLDGIRTKQDELDREVKKRGDADVLVKQQVGRMDEGLEKLRVELDKLWRKSERKSVIQLDAKSAELETKADLEVAGWIGAESDATKGAAYRRAYKAAFDRMVRRGEKALTADETKTLSVGSGPDGGFYIEPARANFIIQRLRETSAMRKIAQVVTITAPSIKIPVDRDDVGYEWVGEQTTRSTTTTPQIGEMEIPIHELSAMPMVTQNMLDDAGFDVEGFVNAKINDKMARGENSAFCTGNGTSKPRGFLTGTPVTTADSSRAFGTLQYIATGVSSAFATASATVSPADKMLDLIYAFNAGYRGSLTWVGNRTTLGAVRKFKDQQGNYIYDARLGANGIIDMVLGYAWEEFADMADYTTANAFAIGLGDFRRGYMVVDKQGIRQLRDPFTSKPYVKFYTTKRVGGAVIDSDAIKLLKFGTS